MNDMTPYSELDHRLAILNQMVNMREILEPSFKHSIEGHTFEDAFNLVASAQASFFWNDTSCAVLEKRSYPAGDVLHCLWAGGTQDGLYALFESVQSLTKGAGFKGMTVQGREGFIKRLPKQNWKTIGIVFFKEFKE
jgi:hypothetical protein